MSLSRQFVLFALATVLLLASGPRSSATVGSAISSFGDLDRWGIVSFGVSKNGLKLSGGSVVDGDAAVGGKGATTLQDNAVLDGDLYYRLHNKLTVSGNATITGTADNTHEDLIDAALQQALATSNEAAGFASTNPSAETFLNMGSGTTVTGAPGETVVLNLKTLKLKGNATLTLDGAATTTMIINVRKGFSLTGSSRIVLTGGLAWNDVLINVLGKGTAKMSDSSHLEGMLLATGRNVKITGDATIAGSVIGKSVAFSGNATLINPPAASP